MLACGLRRSEVADLTLQHLQQREEHWVIADLIGKVGHIRTVPVPGDGWTTAAEITTGPLLGQREGSCDKTQQALEIE
jgi:site-specific recombinase XerC